MSRFLSPVFAPGFFTSGPVHTALVVGGAVAVVSGVVGVFTVVRSQAFAGHAVADLGATGGSASFLVGIGPLWGFLVAALAAAGLMELVGVQRVRERDLATGIVLGAGLGVAALFLYLDTTYTSTSGAAVTVLFGSLFAISGSAVPAAAALGGVAVAAVLVLQRPLMLSTLNPDLAATRGVPVRLVGVLYLVVLGVAVALAALTIGAILGMALLVGPAAAALRIVRRPGAAMLLAAGLGTLATWVGVLLAYDSYLWPPHGRGWPVSFFVVAAVLLIYFGSGLRSRERGSHRLPAQRRARGVS